MGRLVAFRPASVRKSCWREALEKHWIRLFLNDQSHCAQEPHMTPLRQRFIEDMIIRGLAPTTQRSYVHYVADFAKFYNTSPEHLDLEDIREYELFLLNSKRLSPESINCFVSSVQFLYQHTLEVPWGSASFPRVRRAHKLPVVLSSEEIDRFLRNIPNLRYRAALMICYGSGLRVSEAVSLKISDIDSSRMLLLVRQGKGRKDRYAMLSPRLLAVLRSYYRAARPLDYLFPSWGSSGHLTSSALGGACTLAARLAGITKRVTVHTLRHSFATHLL